MAVSSVSLGFLSRTAAGAPSLMAASPRMLGACTPKTPKTPSRSPMSGKSPFSAKSSPTFFTPDTAETMTPSRACSKKRLLFPSSPQGHDISPIATSLLLQKSIAVATATQMQLETAARPSAEGARQHFLERQARRARGCKTRGAAASSSLGTDGTDEGVTLARPAPTLPLLMGSAERPTLLGRRSSRLGPAGTPTTLETAFSPRLEADTPSSAFLSPPSRRHRRTRFADEVDNEQTEEGAEGFGPSLAPAPTPDYERMACGGLWGPVLAGAGGPLVAGPVLVASEPTGRLTLDEGLKQQLPKPFPTMLGAEATSAAEETPDAQPKITITVSRPGQDKLTTQSAAESARAAFLARRARLASRGA